MAYRKTNRSKKKYSRTFRSRGRFHGGHNFARYGDTKVTMGKKFRTKKGKYGCYVYINGKRAFFEEYRR